jgi:hypothetical protein
MANLFYGIGDAYAKTTELAGTTLAQEVITPLFLFEFEYSEDSEALEAKGQIKGVRRTLASAMGEVTSTLRLSTQLVNWSQLGFYLNQMPGQAASTSIPVLKSAIVPASGAAEISDAAIVSGTVDGVYVYISDGANPGYRKKVSEAPAAGEVQVDGTANKLIFHSSDAGQAAYYTIPVTETNVDYYGGANTGKFGTIEFRGVMYGTEDRIWFPSLDFKTTPSFSLSGDVATLEVEFTPNVVGVNNYPYIIYKAAA